MRKASSHRLSSSTESRVAVARVGRPHGVGGAVTAESLSDDPERFQPGARLTTDETPRRDLTVIEVQKSGTKGLILRFAEVSERTSAEDLRGVLLTIASGERRVLGEDEYWPEQLKGLEARAPDGRTLGFIQDVISGPFQDRLVVELVGGPVVEVPFVDDLVPEVSIRGGTVTIVPIEGLLT
ncbi:MAG: ribosome maturation factor RimM [Acidimicrobiia bacterium]